MSSAAFALAKPLALRDRTQKAHRWEGVTAVADSVRVTRASWFAEHRGVPTPAIYTEDGLDSGPLEDTFMTRTP